MKKKEYYTEEMEKSSVEKIIVLLKMGLNFFSHFFKSFAHNSKKPPQLSSQLSFR